MDMSSLEFFIRDHNLAQIESILCSTPQPPQREVDEALADAVDEGFIDAVELLLSHGANITEPAFLGATSRPDNRVFQAFLNHGWDINSTEYGETALRSVMPRFSRPWSIMIDLRIDSGDRVLNGFSGVSRTAQIPISPFE